MVPRGEVGIVGAGFALAEGAIGDDVYRHEHRHSAGDRDHRAMQPLDEDQAERTAPSATRAA